MLTFYQFMFITVTNGELTVTNGEPLQTGINRYKRGKRSLKKHPLALQPQRVTRFSKNQIDYIDLIDYRGPPFPALRTGTAVYN